ncbi:MAG TPA: c-type cytochrome [Burkholderiaceae bacterium]|nr:c-type cytochrome [Burkholderiaceae bacterium]
MNDNTDSSIPKIEDIDPNFEPWEPPRPIPIFLLAVLFALAIAGVGMYLSDLAPWADPGSAKTPASDPVAPLTRPTPSAARPELTAPVLVHSGNDIAWSCASCHGDLGEGAGNTPRLAGLNEGYMIKQLQDFSSGSRIHESMEYVARALQQQDIAEVAAYYASLPVPELALTPSDANLERGRTLFEKGDWHLDVPACISCHGDQGQGVGASFPPLAAQQPEYLFGQLAAWKGGHRHNSPQELMDDIAKRLSYEDLYAVSYYAASLRQQGNNAD